MSRVDSPESSASRVPPHLGPLKPQTLSSLETLWATPWLLLSLLLTVSFTPQFARDSNLDISYQFTLGYAFLHHLPFGTDFLATFGPWGFAYSNFYQPQLWGWLLDAQITLGIAIFAGLWKLARNLQIHPLFIPPWIFLISIWDFLAFDDGRILALCLLPILIRQTSRDRTDPLATYLVIVGLALASLCKFTFLTAATTAIALLALQDILSRRLPRLGLFFIAMLLTLWRISGQHLADLPIFLIDAWKLASGYSAAMGEPGRYFDMIPIFAALSALIAILLFARFWKSDPLGAIVAFLTAASILFICFKQAFVRYDGHELTATVGLMIITSILAPILWFHWPHPKLLSVLFVRALVFVITLTSFFCLAQSYGRFLPGQHLLASLSNKPAIVQDRLGNCLLWIRHGPRIFDSQYEDGLAAIRADCPLPPVTGPTDMFGFSQLAILAANLDYHPRPVSPGFQAWSPNLIEINRRFLLSPSAPENIFFSPETMDGRLPSLDEGPLWPILLSQYNPIEITKTDFLLLRRAKNPRPFTLTPISSKTYRLHESIPVPYCNTSAIYIQIKLHPTLLGQLKTALLRTPQVYIQFKSDDRKTTRQRIIPAIAEPGFILSPVVRNAEDFYHLMTQPTHLPHVTEMFVDTPGADAFDANVEITFQELKYPLVPPQP